MNDTNSNHVPFKNLPFGAKGLFFLMAIGIMAIYRDWPPTLAEIGDDLEAAWDTEQLTEDDFNDFDLMEAVLKKYLAKYASDEGRWWLEEPLQPIRRCQNRKLN